MNAFDLLSCSSQRSASNIGWVPRLHIYHNAISHVLRCTLFDWPCILYNKSVDLGNRGQCFAVHLVCKNLQHVTSEWVSKHCPTVWTTHVWLISIWQFFQGNNSIHWEWAIFQHWFKSTSMEQSLGLQCVWMGQLYNCWCYHRYSPVWYRGSRSTGNLAERCLSCSCFAEPWRCSCCASWPFVS